jgi:hypothetical protein
LVIHRFMCACELVNNKLGLPISLSRGFNMLDWLMKWLEPSTLATFAAAVAAIWYTFETQKLRRATAQQTLNAVFLSLVPVVERHHSPSIADLRRFARDELPQICAKARAATAKLKDFDLVAANKASDVANYYESLGMLIQHLAVINQHDKSPHDVENMLLDMVQKSAHDIWEIFHNNIDVIHRSPDNLGTWAGSFEDLYWRIAVFNPSLPASKGRLPRL